MSSLEQRLQALGRELAFPQEPDIAVGSQPASKPFPWRWGLVLAAAVVALAAALAVPSARTSILLFLPHPGRDGRVGRHAAVGTGAIERRRARSAGLGARG